MSTICGHDRDVVGLGIKILALSDNATAYADQIERDHNASGRIKSVIRDIIDPAKLAEMLAARGRELGLVLFVNPSHTNRTYPNVTIWTPHLTDRFTIMFFSDGGFVSGSVSLDIAGIRRILLQWLQLPDGAREEAERVLRGET